MSSTQDNASGQRLIRFNGRALDAANRPVTGVAGVTFAIYAEQSGGAPLWQETQNLTTDANGRFSALLGALQTTGMPSEVFSSGDSRWLAVLTHSPGVSEQPRVLLVSVPYALRAEDSEMLGGKPASAYMMVNPQAAPQGEGSSQTAGAASSLAALNMNPKIYAQAIAASGAAQGYLPIFTDTAGTLANSAVAQSGSNVGIGTTAPQQTLHLYGNSTGDGAVSGTGLRIQNGSSGAAGITFEQSNASTSLWQFFLQSGPNPSLKIGKDGMADYMTFQNGGNVGIGASAPNGKLDVTGKSTGFVVSGANLDPTFKYPIAFLQNSGTLLEGWNRSAGGGEIDLISNRGPGKTGGFAFYDDTNSGSVNPLVTFQGNGNVGIGTTLPDQMLTVNGSIHSTSGGFVFPDGSVMTSAATTPGSQQQGSNLILPAGNGTDGAGDIQLQTVGTGANPMIDRLLIAGAPKAMIGAVPMANLFSMHIPTGEAAGGRVKFTIVASDGINYAMETGEMIYLASPKQISCAMMISEYSKVPPSYTNTVLAVPPIGQSGSLNAQCSTTTFGSDPGILIFDTKPTSFTPTTHKVYYTIENQSQAAITLQL